MGKFQLIMYCLSKYIHYFRFFELLLSLFPLFFSSIYLVDWISVDLNIFPSMLFVWNTFMGFHIPITGVNKLISIDGISTFHIMDCTSKFT